MATFQKIAYISFVHGKSSKDTKDIEQHIKATTQYTQQIACFKEKGISANYESHKIDAEKKITSELEDSFVVDVIVGHGKKYWKLESLIKYVKENEEAKICLCIQHISSLGSNVELIRDNYCRLVDTGIPIWILEDDAASIPYSTYNIVTDSLISDTELKARKAAILENDIPIKKWTGKNFDLGYSQAFIDAYLLQQNFIIDEAEAILLSGLSPSVFRTKWKKLETAIYQRVTYNFGELDKSENSQSGLYINEMFYEIEELWHEIYGPMLGRTLEEFENLPRRCRLIPEYVYKYQAYLLGLDVSSKKVDSTKLRQLLSSDFEDKLPEISNQHNIPERIPSRTLRKYLIRELAALEKEYNTYSPKYRNSDLCNAITTTFSNKKLPQEEHDIFLYNYLTKKEPSA